MAINRVRQIKPDFFESEKVALVSIEARFFFISLWSRMDRTGVVEFNAKLFASQMFPFDENVTTPRVNQWVDELCNTGPKEESHPLLVKVRKASKFFLWAPGFLEHQRPHNREMTKYALPLEEIKLILSDIGKNGKSSTYLARAVSGPYGLWVMVNGLWVMGRAQDDVDKSGKSVYNSDTQHPTPAEVRKQIDKFLGRTPNGRRTLQSFK